MSASQAAQNRKGEKVPSVLSDTISRRDALLVEVHPRSVQTMSPEELILVQAKLGFGNRYGFWDIPENWLPAGHRVPGKLTIDFRSRLQYVGVPSSTSTMRSSVCRATPSCSHLSRRDRALRTDAI